MLAFKEISEEQDTWQSLSESQNYDDDMTNIRYDAAYTITILDPDPYTSFINSTILSPHLDYLQSDNRSTCVTNIAPKRMCKHIYNWTSKGLHMMQHVNIEITIYAYNNNDDNKENMQLSWHAGLNA